jgi:hypothetical protein
MRAAVSSLTLASMAALALFATPPDAHGAPLQLVLKAPQDPMAAQHAATLDALDTLRRADASLAIGDSDGLDDQLVSAEAALSGRTRLDVEAAREAIARSNLLPARQFLAAALAERRMPQ